MDELIQSLRRDFNRLAAFRVSNGEWTRPMRRSTA